MACLQRAIALQPGLAAAHNNLGLALAESGDPSGAITSYHRALEIDPSFSEAHNNLGTSLRSQGKPYDAVRHFHIALRNKPNFAGAHTNLGHALMEQGKPAQALVSYQQAIRLKPELSEAYLGLGNALKELGKLNEAAASYVEAVRRKENYVEAYANLGNTCEKLGRLDDARACYQANLRLQPQRHWWELRMATVCPTVFHSTAQMDEYERELANVARRMADEPLQIDLAEFLPYASPPPHNLQFFAGNLRPIKEAYADIFCHRLASLPRARRTGAPRVGFVVTRKSERIFLKTMRGILEHFQSGLFESVVLCAPSGRETVRAAIHNDQVHVAAMPDRLDLMIDFFQDYPCDVLYHWEVGTGTLNYFLPFLRPAPIQCTSWGVQVTSGIPQMDYYLSSDLLEPADAAQHYQEKLVRMRTLPTYQYPITVPAPLKEREDFGFRDHQHIYLCAQNLGKFHPDFDPYMAAILRRDEAGIVVISADRHAAHAHKLRDRFAAVMPDVAARIVFVPHLEAGDYLSLVAASDVLLDLPHFSGANTTYDGLALGKPVVTCPSPFQRGRYTYGCYQTMGISECVASSVENYIEIATRLAMDGDYRACVEARIRQTRDVLFNDIEAVREHERVFLELIDKARSQSVV